MATLGTRGPSAGVGSLDLFVRNATGLVRSWASFDAFIYSFFSVNLVALGWFEFSYGPYTAPGGNLITATIISAIILLTEVFVYAGLISVMPRAGGDYVWQTRVLGGGLGFTLAITGWVFTLWLWVPIYGNILSNEVISPICTILASTTGNSTFRDWAINSLSNTGYMVSSVIVTAFAAIVIAAGMKVYARVQKFCFYVGLAGLATMFIMLLLSDHTTFVNGFNHFNQSIFGVSGAYAATLAAAAKNGYSPVSFSTVALNGSFSLIPLVIFYNLYPNWGATLYGEVRGANDFKRNLQAMALALIASTVLVIVSLILIAHVTTDSFYNSANETFSMANAPMPVWPYPGLLVAFLTHNSLLQLWLVVSLSLWFFGWCGTIFLSSTRVIFAAAFDRVLPSWAASVRNGVPVNALLAMVIPGLVLSILYSYNIWSFRTVTLDATLVIAVTFLGSTIVAILLPWRQKRIYDQSPVARYQIAGIPMISVAGVIFLAFLVWNLWKWFSDSIYFVNDKTSLKFLVLMYAVAIVIYLASRIMNSQRGVNLTSIHKEIPIE
jgi:APA family basic amino acid/polyamine antiporter